MISNIIINYFRNIIQYNILNNFFYKIIQAFRYVKNLVNITEKNLKIFSKETNIP